MKEETRKLLEEALAAGYRAEAATITRSIGEGTLSLGAAITASNQALLALAEEVESLRARIDVPPPHPPDSIPGEPDTDHDLDSSCGS